MNRGMSLIELVVSLAIGGITATVLATLAMMQATYTARSQQQLQFNQLTDQIRTIISDGQLCSDYFGTTPDKPNQGVNPSKGGSFSFMKNYFTLSSTPPYNKFGSLTVTNIDIVKYAKLPCNGGPAPSGGCPDRVSFDLAIQAVSPQNFTFNTSVHIIANMLPPPDDDVISECLSGEALRNDEVCGQLGMTWNPAASPPSCSGGGPISFRVAAQAPLTVPPQGNPLTAVTANSSGAFPLCYLTGISGGGALEAESCNLSENADDTWTISGKNAGAAGGPSQVCNWACLK